jgi:hypothetical protein
MFTAGEWQPKAPDPRYGRRTWRHSHGSGREVYAHQFARGIIWERERQKDYRCEVCGWMRATRGYPTKVRIEGGSRVGVCDKCFLHRAEDVRQLLSAGAHAIGLDLGDFLRSGRGRKSYWHRPVLSLWVGVASAAGATPTEIAAATGLSRTIVWRLLAKPSVQGGAAALDLIFKAMRLDQMGERRLPAADLRNAQGLPAAPGRSPSFYRGQRELVVPERKTSVVTLITIDQKLDKMDHKLDELRSLLNTFLRDPDDVEAAQSVDDFIASVLGEAA